MIPPLIVHFGPSDVIDASNDSRGLVVTGIWEQPRYGTGTLMC